MENIAIPAGLGVALVFIVDLIRRGFPQLNATAIKIVVIILSALASVIIVVAQANPDYQKILDGFLVILGVSQTVYAMVLSGTGLQKAIVDDPAAK